MSLNFLEENEVERTRKSKFFFSVNWFFSLLEIPEPMYMQDFKWIDVNIGYLVLLKMKVLELSY